MVYYYWNIPFETDKIFLTISTFLFAIFTGFFIARQGRRYSVIREKTAGFDGNMSAIYRASGHLGQDVQGRVGNVLIQHYGAIRDHKAWDYHFTHKSSTITDIHNILQESLGDESLSSLKNVITMQIGVSLRDLQLLRKNLVALYQERIPIFQWTILFFLTMILLLTLTFIPSYLFLLGAFMKTAFLVSVVAVLLLLYRLDSLQVFKGLVGENSAKDVLDIIAGRR